MGYELDDGEVGIIIKPHLDEDGLWDGTISTGLALDPEAWEDRQALATMIHLSTMMASFSIFIEEHPEMYEAIEEIRNRTMGIDPDEYEEDEEDEVTVEGNVIKLNRWTKTHGNA
jgi:hypothetical protein